MSVSKNMKYCIAIGVLIIFGVTASALKTQWPAAPEEVAKNELKRASWVKIEEPIEVTHKRLIEPSSRYNPEGPSQEEKTSESTTSGQEEREVSTKTNETQEFALLTPLVDVQVSAEATEVEVKTKKKPFKNLFQKSSDGGKKKLPFNHHGGKSFVK